MPDGARDRTMYVCLCNALTDTQVRAAAEAGATRPKEVFSGCGCTAQCASCTRTMVEILREPREAAPAGAQLAAAPARKVA